MNAFSAVCDDKACIIRKNGVVFDANSAFVLLSGFSLSDFLYKPFEYVWNELLRINVTPDFDELQQEALLFTKELEPIFILLTSQKEDESDLVRYIFAERPGIKLNDKYPFLEHLTSRGKLGVAIYNIPDMILMRANQIHLNFLDEPYRSRSCSIGRSLYTIVVKYKWSNIERMINEIIETGEPLELREEPFSGYSRGITYWDTTFIPIYEDGFIKYMIQISQDVTEAFNNKLLLIEQNKRIHQQNEKLLNAEIKTREALEASMKQKDEFIYLISHEMRTPSAIIGSALQAIELMYSKELTPNVRKYLNTIKQNTNRQLRLINNLLDITRISSGNIRLNNTAIEIVNLTKKIVDSVEVYGKQKGIEITFNSELRKKTTSLDEEKLERILLNLIANAVKFTPKGKRIDVHLYSRKRKNRQVICISVNDEGIGIPNDKQLYIFERFGQVDSSLSRQAEGTGLGLTLVKMLIEAMEGEILLESEPGKGSTFTVVLPLIKPVEDIPEPSPYAQSRQLYTDDSRIVRAASIEFSDIYFD